MNDSHTTQTVYGDVEIETRTCASCGQEYLPEDTNTLYSGRVTEATDYSSFESITFEPFARRVYFCESCTDQPIAYILPPKYRVRYRQVLVGLCLGLLVGALLL